MKHKLLFILLLLLTPTTYAATLWVSNSNTDLGTLNIPPSRNFHSIQSAINYASPKDIIKISAGHYFENIIIDKHLSFIGAIFNKKNSNSTPLTVIDGFYNGSVITINPGVKVSITNIRIMNGKSKNGGGINNNGSLMLGNSEIIYNIAQQSGGGIFNARSISGSLFINNSDVSHNKSLGDDKYNMKFGGGGIFNNAPLIINKTTIDNNYAEDNGGGIYSIYSGRKKPSNSEIIAEEIGLSVAPKRKNTLYRKTDTGAVSINQSKITNNIAGSGGGINLQGVMNIRKTSIHKNKAKNHKRAAGGGIFAHLDTTLFISNTTISQNEAAFRGAGIRFYSTKTGALNNVTIIDNVITKSIGQGAGLFFQNHSKMIKIKHSVIARNTIMNKYDADCYGKILSNGYNFIGALNKNKYRCKWISDKSDIVSENQKINPRLKWNKTEQRYFMLNNSPLKNSGSSHGCTDEQLKLIKRDQFGHARLYKKNKQCDIGAMAFID